VTIFTTMSRLALERDAINLSQGFPDFNCAPELIEAVARYMREGHNQYAPMPGTIALREALAMKIERLYGCRYDPVSEITITSGATEALFATLTALVHPGEEVLLFQPAYDSYVPAIQLSGGTPVFVTMRPP
jgi:methionine aminotransferase